MNMSMWKFLQVFQRREKNGGVLLHPACYLYHQACDPVYLWDYRSLITVKINLIRNHISSHSFNYQDKLGVGDGELE